MNYRHAFHAGNFADVFKHAVLARCLAYMTRKETPLRFIDTHAGIGVYRLGGEPASRTREWEGGVARLWPDADLAPAARELLAPWLDAVTGLNLDGHLSLYPGSPAIARSLLRAQDRLGLCELHPEDARALGRWAGRDRRIKVTELDGYLALAAWVPPAERRGLILVDPPFEAADEFARIGKALATAFRKWPTGTYMVWYPVKAPGAADDFAQDLVRQQIGPLMRIEFAVARPDPHAPLAATGLLIVNPPFVLADELRILMPALVDRLRRGEGAGWGLEEYGRT